MTTTSAAPARETRKTRRGSKTTTGRRAATGPRRPERDPDMWQPSRRGFSPDIHLPQVGAGPWTSQASCAQPGTDPDLWFSDTPGEIRAAQTICASCPVRRQCAQLGTADGYQVGVWAGIDHTPRENPTTTAAASTTPDTPPNTRPAPAAAGAQLAIPAQQRTGPTGPSRAPHTPGTPRATTAPPTAPPMALPTPEREHSA